MSSISCLPVDSPQLAEQVLVPARQMSELKLTRLPPELIHHILQFLDPKSTATCLKAHPLFHVLSDREILKLFHQITIPEEFQDLKAQFESNSQVCDISSDVVFKYYQGAKFKDDTVRFRIEYPINNDYFGQAEGRWNYPNSYEVINGISHTRVDEIVKVVSPLTYEFLIPRYGDINLHLKCHDPDNVEWIELCIGVYRTSTYDTIEKIDQKMFSFLRSHYQIDNDQIIPFDIFEKGFHLCNLQYLDTILRVKLKREKIFNEESPPFLTMEDRWYNHATRQRAYIARIPEYYPISRIVQTAQTELKPRVKLESDHSLMTSHLICRFPNFQGQSVKVELKNDLVTVDPITITLFYTYHFDDFYVFPLSSTIDLKDMTLILNMDGFTNVTVSTSFRLANNTSGVAVSTSFRLEVYQMVESIYMALQGFGKVK